MAELMLGQPLFPGESGIDQLVEIIKVLGTPSREQIKTMNPNYMEHKFPQIKPHPFSKVRLLYNPFEAYKIFRPCSSIIRALFFAPFVFCVLGFQAPNSGRGDRLGCQVARIHT